jgi:ribulose-5-phosphate 4-epimerase/fuculose-1-phosphate aldolase
MPVHEVTNVDPVIDAAKQELAVAFRAAALHGYTEGIDNHFSLLVPGTTDRFLLNPFGPHWSELRARDLLTVDRDGSVVEGDGGYERTAFVIHRAVHEASPQNRCVLHAHMPYATAVSTMRDGLDTTLSQSAMYFEGRTAYVDYGGLASDHEEGERLAAAVAPGVSVVILRNHGVLVIGGDVAAAWQNLYFLERACQVQVLAGLASRELCRVDRSVVERTGAAVAAEGTETARLLFAAVRRQVDRELPGYDTP